MPSLTIGNIFPRIKHCLEWIRNPFRVKTQIEHVSSKLPPRHVDSFVEIASDGTMKMTFRENKSLTDFWVHIQPELADSALKMLMPFPTTYNFEIGISTLVGLKAKQHNPDIRLKFCSLEPDIVSLMKASTFFTLRWQQKTMMSEEATLFVKLSFN